MTGRELQELRSKYDLTQKALGALLGYHANYISRLEREDEVITPRFEKFLRSVLTTQTLRRHRLAKGIVSLKEWERIKQAYHSSCAYCGKQQERLVQDHIIPLDNDGPHTAENIVPACRSCNSKKGNREEMKPMQPHEIEGIIRNVQKSS